MLLIVLLSIFCCINAELQNDGIYGDRKSPDSTRRSVFENDETLHLDDMIITQDMKTFLFDPNVEQRRNAVNNEDLLWPDKTVRYFIDSEFDKSHRAEIKKGMKMITSKSCIKFEELSKPPANPSFDKPYLHINSISGCYSQVGATCKKCPMSLDINGGCVVHGTIAHELLHSLGFYHMQCSAGRDKHIEIVWDNLQSSAFSNFEEYADQTTLLGTTYDYESIMHYGPSFFSKNRGLTIKTKDPNYQYNIGQRTHLSQGDIERLNILYKC